MGLFYCAILPRMPTSQPITPSQPALAEYPASELETLVEYPTAQAYLAKFGELPPKFDHSRPIQSWFDETPTPPNTFVYEFFGIKIDSASNPTIATFTIG